MADMMKAMGGAKRGPMAGLANMMGFGGGMPSQEEMQKLAEQAQKSGLPGGGGLPKLPPNFPGAPSLPGLGGKFPGLPGGLPPGLGKKK
ncbi:MAG: signal recognition particle protein, partial [Pseudolabrys sp.]|nr:signal recognition particle protein [Pseudolabrys sp.]